MKRYPKFSAVLFDFDGTVAYTAGDVWESVRYGFHACGLELDSGFSADNRNLAMPVGQMVQLLYPGAPADTAARVREAVNLHYRRLSAYGGTVLYPGLEELLRYLKEAGVATGILSNKGHASLGRILEKKNWLRYFDTYQGTPDSPDAVLEKSERLRQFARRFDITRAAYVGDSYGDVVAARDNGLFSVGVLYGDGDPELVRRERPDRLCETSLELYHFFVEG